MPTFDPHPNAAISTVLVAPNPPTTGTTLTVQPGDGAVFAAGAPLCLRAPGTARPLEIGRLTAVVGDVLTFTRHVETDHGASPLGLPIAAGWQVFQGPTAKTESDQEAAINALATGAAHAATHLPAGSDALDWVGRIHQKGTFAARPTPAATNAGCEYFATDTGILYRSDGTSWLQIGISGGAPLSVTVIDGGDVALGATSDASSATTVIGLLKKLASLLPAALVGGRLSVDGSGVTQPVSASALPLPTGASTAAKQPALGTAGTASADVLSVQGIASMTALKTDGSGVTQPVTGTVADGAADAGNTVKVGGVDGGGLRQPFKISGTGGLQVTPDTLNKLDDNIIAVLGSDYAAQQTVTMNGSATTATFTQSLLGAGPSVESIRSATVAIETSGIGQSITSATLSFTDTVGSTASVGPIYQLFNVPPTAAGSAPTFLVGTSTTATILLPVMDRGALKNAVLTLTLAGAGTNASTIKVQLKFNPYELTVGPEYLVMANLQSQGTLPNTTVLCASAGANTRLYLLSGRITNGHASTASRVTLLSGSNGLVLDGGVANPLAGFLLGPYGPLGLPMNAQARGLFIASAAAASIDVFVQLRVGT